jgi:hypothetical protein
MSPSLVDTAIGEALRAPDDPDVRLALFRRFLSAEWFVLTEDEEGERPSVFPVSEGPVIAAFDREEGLAEFVGAQASFAVSSGRLLVVHLQAQDLGIAVNLTSDHGGYIFGKDDITWLAEQTPSDTVISEARPSQIGSPVNATQALVKSIDEVLATLTDVAIYAVLVQVQKTQEEKHLILIFVDLDPNWQDAVYRSISEVVSLSGVEGLVVDVTATSSGSALAKAAQKVGIRFDLPQTPPVPKKAPPGSDPDRPPRLQ